MDRPGIIGVNGMAERWHISRARVRQLAGRPEFPEPIPETRNSRVNYWWLTDIQRYEPNRKRPTLGRPRREASETDGSTPEPTNRRR